MCVIIIFIIENAIKNSVKNLNNSQGCGLFFMYYLHTVYEKYTIVPHFHFILQRPISIINSPQYYRKIK